MYPGVKLPENRNEQRHDCAKGGIILTPLNKHLCIHIHCKTIYQPRKIWVKCIATVSRSLLHICDFYLYIKSLTNIHR